VSADDLTESEYESRDDRTRNRPARRLLGCGLWALGGLALGATLAIVIAQRDAVPELTPAMLRAAMTRWEERHPAHYRAEITVRGQRPSQLQIEVRNGQPVTFTLNGQTPKNTATAEFWTLENLLTVVDEELDAARDPTKRGPHFNIPPKAQVDQRAAFDPDYGYPRRYRRTSRDANLELDWTVEKFTVLSE